MRFNCIFSSILNIWLPESAIIVGIGSFYLCDKLTDRQKGQPVVVTHGERMGFVDCVLEIVIKGRA